MAAFLIVMITMLAVGTFVIYLPSLIAWGAAAGLTVAAAALLVAFLVLRAKGVFARYQSSSVGWQRTLAQVARVGLPLMAALLALGAVISGLLGSVLVELASGM